MFKIGDRVQWLHVEPQIRNTGTIVAMDPPHRAKVSWDDSVVDNSSFFLTEDLLHVNGIARLEWLCRE